MNNILTKIKVNIQFMSKVEKKIASEIIASPEKFIAYSIAELSDKIGVSQGSIIKFSNKYSDGGFVRLKLMISGCMSVFNEKSFDIIEKGDTIKNVMLKNIEAYDNAFDVTLSTNDEKILNEIAEKIINAKKVEIYGIYRSATVAMDFYYQLLQLGISASFVSDILTCSLSASMLDKDAVVVAVSSSGKTKDIIDAVKNAKANNVSVISVTSNEGSPLAKLSDYLLISSSSGRFEGNMSTEIRSSQLLLIDTICSFVRGKLGEDSKKRFYEIKEILSSHNVEEEHDE